MRLESKLRVSRWWALGIWLLGTLVAIAVMADAPFLGLGIALGSGVLFGFVNVFSNEKKGV